MLLIYFFGIFCWDRTFVCTVSFAGKSPSREIRDCGRQFWMGRAGVGSWQDIRLGVERFLNTTCPALSQSYLGGWQA